MSEPLVRERHSIDLDDFERRLRQPESGQDHPLANLARLVDEHDDPYGDVFAEHAAPFPPVNAHAMHGRREPAFDAHPARLAGDFASIEAGLRGTLSAHPEAAPHGDTSDHEFYAQNQQYAQDDAGHPLQNYEAQQGAAWSPAPPRHVAPVPSGRGRRPLYAMVATIAVGIVGVGVAFAYKGSSRSPDEVRTIAAAAGPSKIAPPKDTAAEKGDQDSAVLSKDGHEAPTQLVSREEQPVDLGQAVQANNSRNADTGTGSQGDASSVPVPLSPSEARNAPAESASSDSMGGFGVGMPAPKKVKVVSVRPDGTILPHDALPAGALAPAPAAPPQTAGDVDPIAKASTPQTASTSSTGPKETASKSIKSTSRVATPAKIEKAAVGDGADAAPAKPAKAKAQRLASVQPTDGGDDATASLGGKGGGFAVQLAAPGSEADARSASARLSKKYADALSGRHIGFHKAQSNGKSVYRVRVGSLSKSEAVSLCEKLKSNGGSCFVAKN